MIYIGNADENKGNNVVSIERWSPDIDCLFYADLCPEESIVNEYKTTGNKEKFAREYWKQLNLLHPNQVAGDLDGKVLVCRNDYGEDIDICAAIQAWLRANGIECQVKVRR